MAIEFSAFGQGQRVMLTEQGAKDHRNYQIGTRAAMVGSLFTPVGLVGNIGIAVQGTAYGVKAAAIAAAAGGAGACAGGFGEAMLGTYPEAGSIGKVVEISKRAHVKYLGANPDDGSFDYKVEWDNGSESWHLMTHLMKVD